MREIVEKGYDAIDYSKCYRKKDDIDEYPFEKENIDGMIESLRPGGKILDLGCGPGVPFDRYLVERGFALTGVDISGKQIEEAKRNVPDARFIRADMTSVAFDDASFDAVMSLYAIFHIPREEHKGFLVNIGRMLKPEGPILITTGTDDEDHVTEFLGSPMPFSSYPTDDNLRLVKECGFRILRRGDESEHGSMEKHLWILARKIDQ